MDPNKDFGQLPDDPTWVMVLLYMLFMLSAGPVLFFVGWHVLAVLVFGLIFAAIGTTVIYWNKL